MKKILYVEDNPDINEAVKIILTKAGFETDTSLNGTDGLKKAKSKKFDLILLDVMLPDMSGWDIYAKLKPKVNCKYAFLSAIPIGSDRMEELLKEGVSDYITKPFVETDLIIRVKKILK